LSVGVAEHHTRCGAVRVLGDGTDDEERTASSLERRERVDERLGLLVDRAGFVSSSHSFFESHRWD
jgi:carbonic anhydrase